MATAPDHSLPQQQKKWSDIKSAYRFLNHPQVTPDEIQRTHREQVRTACAQHDCILNLQDGSELDYTAHPSVEGLGFAGGGIGRGLLQHSCLAVTPQGELLGVLHQIWWRRVETPEGETRRERQARARESDLWANSIRAVAGLGLAPRVIHVMDRGSDCFETMQAAHETGSGFLLRARHDRYVHDGTETLWRFMEHQDAAGTRDVCVPPRPAESGKPAQPARVARLAVRFAAVQIPPPRNDPRFTVPLSAWAVYILETDPPEGVDPIEWMLWTSEPVHTLKDAQTLVDWYTLRWIIEEWHKVEKTGCRLEASQLKSVEALERLAAFTAVVAVRLLQLRDVAQTALQTPTEDPGLAGQQPASLQPAALRTLVPGSWIAVVSHLARCPAATLTPRMFWWTLAQRGGFIGRKSDGLPGWQTIWKGWWEVMMLVQGFEIHRSLLAGETCG